MELESDLAKELFNKVIVPLQTKNKQKEITVQNEYERTQEQLQDTRNKQQELDKLRVQGAKAIADEKANRLAQEAEAARVAREEADRMAKEEAARLAQEAETERVAREKAEADKKAQEEANRLAQEAETEHVAREKAEADKKAQEEAARRAQIEVEKQAIEQGDRLITPIKAAEEGEYRMKQREFKRIAPIEAATKGAERMAKEVNIPPPPPPSSETITTDLGESIQNKFDVNPLLQTLTNTLNKDLSLDTEISPPPPVPMFNVNQLIHILNKSLAMPAPVAPSTAVVPAPAPATVPTPTAVVPSTAPSTSVVAPTAVVPAPAPPSTAVVPAPVTLPVTLPVAPSTVPVTLPVAPSTPPVILPVAPSTAVVPTTVPTPTPAQVVVPPPSPAQVVVPPPAPAPAIQQQPSTITPASPPEPVSSIISSIDWKGNLDWLKQSVGLLIGSLSNMFTFKAAEDNDPYKLSTSKVNEGYIYIGKMYMKNDDETLPSKQVKYVNYHPEKKEFYIDEKPEVVN